MCVRKTLWLEKFEGLMKWFMKDKALKKWFNISAGQGSLVCQSAGHNPVISNLSKHMNLKWQFLINNVGKDKFHLRYDLTDEMVANFFTNDLGNQKCRNLGKKTEMLMCRLMTFARVGLVWWQ